MSLTVTQSNSKVDFVLVVDPCGSISCKNGGTCKDGKCVCPFIYGGTECDGSKFVLLHRFCFCSVVFLFFFYFCYLYHIIFGLSEKRSNAVVRHVVTSRIFLQGFVPTVINIVII